jgi:hypothetical protein
VIFYVNLHRSSLEFVGRIRLPTKKMIFINRNYEEIVECWFHSHLNIFIWKLCRSLCYCYYYLTSIFALLTASISNTHLELGFCCLLLSLLMSYIIFILSLHHFKAIRMSYCPEFICYYHFPRFHPLLNQHTAKCSSLLKNFQNPNFF